MIGILTLDGGSLDRRDGKGKKWMTDRGQAFFCNLFFRLDVAPPIFEYPILVLSNVDVMEFE